MRCRHCKVNKPESDFAPGELRPGSKLPDGRRWCRTCVSAKGKRYYTNNKESIVAKTKNRMKCPVANERRKAGMRRYSRARKLRDRGLTPNQYDAVLKAQNGACAICKKPSLKRLNMDHDHASGKFRGLLCGTCNTGLGLFKDDPAILAGAIAYLL